MEAQALGCSVLPRRGAEIRHNHLAFATVELGDLTELQRIALAGAAGEIIEDAAAHGVHRALPARGRELEVVNRAVRGERGGAAALRRRRQWERKPRQNG